MAVVVGRLAQRGQSLPPLSSLADFLPFHDGVTSCESIGGGDLAATSWGAPGDHRVARVGQRLLVVDGTPAQSHEELIRALTASRPPQIGELGGSFAAVILEEGSLVAYSSAGADYPLYWGEREGRLIVANRPALVVGATNPTIDVPAALNMASDGFFPFGYRMFNGVRQLLPGERLRIRSADSALVCSVDSPELQPLFDTASRGRPRELAAMTERCINAAVESVGRAPVATSPRLRLSGGKDSRAVLAMIAESGSLDRLESIVTTGSMFSTDVLSAQALAKALGIEQRHVVQEPGLEFAPGHVAAVVVGAMSALGSGLSLFNLGSDVLAPDRLTYNGHETALKSSALSRYPTGTLAEFCANASRDALDPAGILTSQARDDVVAARSSGFTTLHDDGVPVDRLAEVVNWRQRGGGWTGTTLVAHRAANRHCSPLMDPALVGLSFSLPRVCSDGELIPFLLTSRSPVNLVDVPFGNASWRAELHPALAAVDMSKLTPRRVPGFGIPKPVSDRFRPWVSPLRGAILRSLVPVIADLASVHRATSPFIDRPQLELRLAEAGAGKLTDPRADIALLGLATVLLTAEYGTDLYRLSTRAAVAEDLSGRLAAIQGISSTEQIVDIYRQEVRMRDGVIAGFVKREQAQAAARAARLAWLPPRARKAAGKVRRKLA